MELKWQTASEKDNDYFTVERSINETDFESVAKVKGAGTSTTVKTYSIIDFYPFSGIAYYRLKQTDYDGTYTYSEVKSVKNIAENRKSLKLYNISPNPFKDRFTINFNCATAGKGSVSIFNGSGQLVYDKNIETVIADNKLIFTEGEQLSSGTYILSLKINEETVTKKIVKSSM